MRLKSMSVRNFRAINGKNNIIRFDNNNIVFLFGKNNIGKSSILYAYEYFSSPTQKALLTDFYNNNPKNKIEIEAVFLKESSDDETFNNLNLNKWVDDNGIVKFKKTWDTLDEKASKETYHPKNKKYEAKGFGGLETILTHATPNVIFIEAIPNVDSLIKWLDDRIKKELLKSLKENHKSEYEEALVAVNKLQQKIEEHSYLTNMALSVNQYFNSTFPDLEIKILQDKNKETDLTKAFEKDFGIAIGKKNKDNRELIETAKALEEIKEQVENTDFRRFDLHGHALVRQAIVTILGLFSNTKEGEKHIILFEEPELYLHPSNKRRFRETLYKLSERDDYQIICISHDPQLIDLSKEHMSLARFVQNSDGTTEIYQTDETIFNKDEETKDRVQMLNRFNPHICESFFADEVILVEGDTEAIVLRELIHKHYPKKEIFVLNTGSKNNIPFFINILSNFKINQHIIHDSDERYLYENDGTIKLKNDETPKSNSAWSINDNIWKAIENAKCRNNCSIKRYVSIRNFEHAHNYSHDPKLGKPLSAYLYAQNLDIRNNEISIVKQLKQITGDLAYDEEFTPESLDKLVQEPNR
ncbi:ATP-dependent nuclease [Proteus vulgaris]|uniref:ATP-dependent nuclease n=1 Tax=Proteus vulgaris TaxID=585 RepID=UPI0021A4678B|nr:AAA family ATPase [Proteus vulgaris]